MLQHKCAGQRQRAAGFTLIETMIVVIIVSVLAGIALPAYQNSMLKGRRSDAMGALLDASNQLEQYMLDHSTYTTNLSLIFPPERITGTTLLRSAEDFYVITATACAVGTIANCYTLTAAPPTGGVQEDDTMCGSLILDSDGKRTATGNLGSGCW